MTRAPHIADELLEIPAAIGADVFILRAAAYNIRQFGDVPLGSVIRRRLWAISRDHVLKDIRDLAERALDLTGSWRP